STLSLMDAGVPLKAPVAGIAMGLVTREGRHAVMTDIQGVEDALGDMDFKVAGTREGITALQMDIKVKGLTQEVMAQALEQAREARLFILDRMLTVLPRPRETMSPYAPRITTIHINPDKIRDVIGPGGKVIRKIVEETGAQIDVEDDGTVYVSSVNQDDQIVVKAVEIDKQGRLNLSRQAALDELKTKGEPIEESIDPEKVAAAIASGPPPPREPREGGGFGGGSRDRGGFRGRRDG